MDFLLQDSRTLCGGNMMFWAEKGGYTTNVRLAELFTKDEAQRQHNSRESDIPLPLAYVDQLAWPTVDCQYLKE